MKKLLLITLLALPLSGWAEPPEPGHHPDGQGAHHGRRMQHMKDELGLSDEQVEQIREIRRNGGSREDVRSVLTEEQLAKMDEMRAQHEGHKKKGGEG